jgi:ABC-type uncharacterized transport system fused permease/ATPase subunit
MRKRVGMLTQSRLLKGNVLYNMSVDGRLDNFDQRLTNDLQILLDGLCCVFFGNTNDYIAYPIGYTVCRLGCAFQNTFYPPNQTVALTEAKKANIGFMIVVTFSITMLAYVGPMNIISKLVYKTQRLEGNFHTTHARTIQNAEAICLYNGEAREKTHADSQFGKLHATLQSYYKIQGVLMFLRVTVTICQPAVGMMLLSLSGATDASYASAFLKQIGNVLEFSLDLPTLIARLAFASGTAHRVGQLLDAIDVFETSEMTQVALDDAVKTHIKVRLRTYLPLLRNVGCVFVRSLYFFFLRVNRGLTTRGFCFCSVFPVCVPS